MMEFESRMDRLSFGAADIAEVDLTIRVRLSGRSLGRCRETEREKEVEGREVYPVVVKFFWYSNFYAGTT